MHANTHTHTHTHTHKHTHTHTCTHTYIHTHARTHARMHTHTHTHMHARTHAHTHTHTHTHFFSIAKAKKGNKGKKIFKEETIKRLSLREKCYCFNHSRASRTQNFCCQPTMVTNSTLEYSMAPPFWNPFHRPCLTNFHLL